MYRRTIVLFLSYETISFRLYLEVVASLNYRLLVVIGHPSDEDCREAWEKIIRKCYEKNGGFDFINFVDLNQKFGNLLAEYNIVKALLTKLWFQVDNDWIEQLSEKGYHIITERNDPKFDNTLTLSENYAQSIKNGLQRAENLVTKMAMSSKEISLLLKDGDGGRKNLLFDEAMATLQARNINVSDDISLCRYLELIKVLNKKEEMV